MQQTALSPAISEQAAAVGRFYDEQAEAFLRVYGDVLQAFRTNDVRRLLDHEAQAMGLAEGLKTIDAGCGVGGPAVYFAQQYGVRVDAVTVSARQAALASEKAAAAGVGDRVGVHLIDFHDLGSSFEKGSYDVVFFLESFGHSHDKPRAIEAAWQMLVPGGRLYIKDLFVRQGVTAAHQQTIDWNVRNINEAYHYEVADLSAVVRDLRRRGFILSAVRTVDIPLEEFENLTISNEFQALTGINRVDDLSTYEWPVDFFELLCIKPWYDLAVGNTRYFLQNLYQLRIQGMTPDQL